MISHIWSIYPFWQSLMETITEVTDAKIKMLIQGTKQQIFNNCNYLLIVVHRAIRGFIFLGIGMVRSKRQNVETTTSQLQCTSACRKSYGRMCSGVATRIQTSARRTSWLIESTIGIGRWSRRLSLWFWFLLWFDFWRRL